MKLDFDIAKDILVFLEEYLVLDLTDEDEKHKVEFTEDQICDYFSGKYLDEDIRYAILKLAEADYIDAKQGLWIVVTDITYHGHEFIDSIRDKGVFEKGKNAMKKTGASSLSMLGTVCSEIVKAAVLNQLGL